MADMKDKKDKKANEEQLKDVSGGAADRGGGPRLMSPYERQTYYQSKKKSFGDRLFGGDYH